MDVGQGVREEESVLTPAQLDEEAGDNENAGHLMERRPCMVEEDGERAVM